MADGWRNHWLSLGSSHHPTKQRSLQRNKEQNKRQLNSKRTELWHSQTRTELLCYASLLRVCSLASLSLSISLSVAHTASARLSLFWLEGWRTRIDMMAPCVCVTVYWPPSAAAFWSNISKRNLLKWSNGLLVAPFGFFVRTTSNSNKVARGLQRGQLRSIVAFCAHLFLISCCLPLVKSEIKAKQLKPIRIKTTTRSRVYFWRQ